MTPLSELSQKHYHLKNLFKDLSILANQAIGELDEYDEDSADTILDDINEILEEAKNNGFIE